MSASRRAIPPWLSESLVLAAAVALDLLMWNGDDALLHGADAPSWLVPAGSVATLAALLLRRRFAGTVLVVQLLWASGCGVTFEAYTPMTGIIVALHALAVQRTPVSSLLGWVACSLPFAMYSEYYDDSRLRFTMLLVLMLAVGTAWLLGYRTRCARQRAAERERETTDAVRSERLRIARELHDIVAHAVSVMVLQVAGARAVLVTDPHRAEAALDTVQDVGVQSMNELRRLLGLLRSAGGTDPAAESQPGLDGIDALLANARATGLTVTRQEWGTPGLLDPSVGLAAYRLVQEALTNTLKHAGPQASVRVGLAWTDDDLTVTVQNEAPVRRAAGTAALSTGHGLLGLRERVQTAGGSLHTGPTSTGFIVQAVLPAAARPSAVPETIVTSS
ncbi:ATPase [Actinoplanes italicus]|uniref:histidine kinase n=1 Tax=Actinoplanes italicus TaxID=113567 RepID=A0A2T0KHD4_9ACTN|nr:histidine kinase [Actinoplanes italicus]PRX22841.1 signal transduction histidine kinase [Actinoplanes italicus]GIE28363.1 ATPase [Actinoplanes italicus]